MGRITPPTQIAPSQPIWISKRGDFPPIVNGTITLEANRTYFITRNVDLFGARLIGSENTCIIGGSSENAILTSTGLDASTPLFTTTWSTSIRDISFKDVGVAINIQGTTNSAALIWNGVNFVNVPEVGEIDGCGNFIFSSGAFLNSKGLVFTGVINTIGFDNTYFQGDTNAGNIIQLNGGAEVTNRFRIIYSSFVVTGSTIGIDVDTGAVIADESYILDTVSFSGGGTYLTGVNYTDNKALFSSCKGIDNSSNVSQYYMNNNATVTPVAAANTPYKALGTTTSSSVTQKFTNTNNRATYTGALNTYFKVSASLSVISSNNNEVGVFVAKNGTVLPESEIFVTTNSSGRAEGGMTQTLTQLSNGDYIEIFVENITGANDITVTDLNVIVE